jgi:DNA-binding transcriptional LysR family regulator
MTGDRLDLEVRELRILVAIAEHGSITAAAATLGIRQPGVSRALSRLEARLGVRLVHRTTRSLELTPAGEAFRRAAVRALAAVDDAVAAARKQAGPLRLGFSWSAAGRHTVPILRTWHERYPSRPVQMNRHDDRSAGLDAGEVDLALVRVRLDRSRYAMIELNREGRCVAVPDGDPLAGRERVRLADLAGRALAVVSAYGTTTLDLWPVGARPTIVADARNIDDWLAVIAAGRAIGLTAASTAVQHPAPGIAFVPVADAPPLVTWLAWERSGQHPWRREFVELARGVVSIAG